MRKDKGKRILTALSLPVIAALVYIYEKQGGSGMKCLFHSYTGLYCPGCGSGRAVHALFEGRIAEAVRYNILLPILGTPGHQIHGIRSQFSSFAQSCPTLCDPMNCSTPGLPVHHQLPEFTQTHVHRVSDAIQPSHPLSSPSPSVFSPSQHQNLFQ